MAKNKKTTPAKPKPKVPFEQVMKNLLFSLAFFFVLRELLSVAAEALLLSSGEPTEQTVGLFYLLRSAISLLITLPAYLLVSKVKRDELAGYYKPDGWDRKKLGGVFALLCAATMLPLLAISLVMGIRSGFTPIFGAELPTWQAIVYTVLAMPLMEELVFRGVVLHRIKPYGARRAILITAGLFAIGHGSLGNILLGILPGLVLSAAVYFGLSLGGATLMHMAVNLLGNALLPWALHTGGAPMWGVVALFVLLSAAGVFVLVKRKDVFGELDFSD